MKRDEWMARVFADAAQRDRELQKASAGLAVLCFSACMAIAAGGGIRKRFIALAAELDVQRGGGRSTTPT